MLAIVLQALCCQIRLLLSHDGGAIPKSEANIFLPIHGFVMAGCASMSLSAVVHWGVYDCRCHRPTSDSSTDRDASQTANWMIKDITGELHCLIEVACSAALKRDRSNSPLMHLSRQ